MPPRLRRQEIAQYGPSPLLAGYRIHGLSAGSRPLDGGGNAPTIGGYTTGRGNGFTLLETLVALVVLGLLVIGLTHGVSTGLALWNAQTRRIGEAADLDAAERTLRNLLSGIPTNPAGDSPQGAITFDGSSSRLAFVGDLPTGLGTTQRANIDLELEGKRLILRWTPHRHEISSAPAPPPIDTVLAGGVRRLELAYWGSPAADQPAAWQGQWQGSQIPELIRVRVRFEDGDRRHWPDLIVASGL
jgi:general secretion pathway protein J